MGKGKSERCENCLDAPVKYSSILLSIIVVLVGLASIFLVPYFGGIVNSPLEPSAGPNGTASNPTPVSNSTGNGTACGDLSANGGLSVLGFLLINHGLFAAFLGGVLTMSWHLDETLGFVQGNIGKAVSWFFAATVLLGLCLTFYVPDLGGPQHLSTAVVYLTVVGFSYLMSGLFCLRRCCGNVGAGGEYNSSGGGFQGA